MDACNFRGVGFALCLCNTKAKLAIKQNGKLEFSKDVIIVKSFISLAMVLLLSITYRGCTYRGCSAPPSYREENPSFSYQEEMLVYSEDLPNVKRDGFVNTEELERAIDNDLDAVDQAIKEYTLEQSSPYYIVFFDPESNTWKVVFNYFDEDAEKQAVYMNEKGKTLLIVYLE